MPKEKMGPEQFKAAKEKINKEGMLMEEGEEGGAAVYVGTREEIDKAKKLVETEGRAPDLASYIIINKQTIATKEELDSFLKFVPDLKINFDSLPKGTMVLFKDIFLWNLYFKDSSGNLAKVVINRKKIANFSEPTANVSGSENEVLRELDLREKLAKLGFSMSNKFGNNNRGDSFDPINFEKYITEKHLKKAAEEQKKGFSF